VLILPHSLSRVRSTSAAGARAAGHSQKCLGPHSHDGLCTHADQRAAAPQALRRCHNASSAAERMWTLTCIFFFSAVCRLCSLLVCCAVALSMARPLTIVPAHIAGTPVRHQRCVAARPQRCQMRRSAVVVAADTALEVHTSASHHDAVLYGQQQRCSSGFVRPACPTGAALLSRWASANHNVN
jgi:hypothetical protein